MKRFKFYSDPSHGWLAVKLDLLNELNILDDITNYSYIRGSTVYLEEDQDAKTFLDQYEKKHGPCLFENRTTNSRSTIRSYESYSSFTANKMLNKERLSSNVDKGE